MTLLEVQGIVKKFGGLVALDHVCLEVEEGAVLGLIGPNGAGKTTLLNVIAGVYSPDSGRVFLEEQDITGLAPEGICERGIARTFQIPQPFPEMTVFENVLVGVTFGGHAKGRNAEARAHELLDMVEFPSTHDMVAKRLNTVQLKRLDLARALASRPKVLLLDEVATGLAPTELVELMDLVLQIQRTGLALIVVEHLMKVIMGVCDRVVVLHYGERIGYGTCAQIARDQKVVDAYLGEKYLL